MVEELFLSLEPAKPIIHHIVRARETGRDKLSLADNDSYPLAKANDYGDSYHLIESERGRDRETERPGREEQGKKQRRIYD